MCDYRIRAIRKSNPREKNDDKVEAYIARTTSMAIPLSQSRVGIYLKFKSVCVQ